jgi:hypothetical protein
MMEKFDAAAGGGFIRNVNLVSILLFYEIKIFYYKISLNYYKNIFHIYKLFL